jgi:hypothetical protein
MPLVQLETMEKSEVFEELRLMWKKLENVRDIEAISDESSKD